MPIKNRLAELHQDITEWRRDLHTHPELMFDTHRTSALVAEKLRAFGCDEVVTGLGKTGVVGVIRGCKTGSGRVIGLRADMDALPIDEETGLDYASTTPGKMHACGHDGHTAMLLGAARYLTETRNFDGTVVVIFQPAEEGGGGGDLMVKDGLMERFGIQEVYGMHNMPGIPVGQFAIRKGPFFAAADQFEIEITGRGGHAAKPHETVDATVVAAHVIVALQTIASRTVNPVENVVVSVTAVETDTRAHNVIAGRVRMLGTVRTLDTAVRDLAAARMSEIAEGTAKAFGAVAKTTYHYGYPVMANHDAQTDFAAEVAREVSGQCDEAAIIMGGEDFAYMLNARPGAYILVGNGDSAMIHHPKYNFNDDAIPAGSSWWVGLAEKGMPVSA